MPNLARSKTMIDLTRFAYLVAARLDALDISMREAQAICGVTSTQISHAKSGKPITAGATWTLCAFLEIDMRQIMPIEVLERLRKIEKYKEKQGVALNDTRETGELSAMPIAEAAE